MILDRDFSFEAAESRILIAGWLLAWSEVVAVVILVVSVVAMVASIKAFTREPRVYAVKPNGAFYEVRHFSTEAEAAAWAVKAGSRLNKKPGQGRNAVVAAGVSQ